MLNVHWLVVVSPLHIKKKKEREEEKEKKKREKERMIKKKKKQGRPNKGKQPVQAAMESPGSSSESECAVRS